MASSEPETLAYVRSTWQRIHEQNPATLPEHVVQEATRELARFLLKTQFLLIYRVPELKALFCSEGVEHMLGCPRDEFSFEWLYARVHPDDAQLVAEATALSAKFADKYQDEIMGHVFTVDYRVQHRDGHWVRVLRQNFPIRAGDDGKLLLVGSIYTDITRHKLTTDVRFHLSHPAFTEWITQEVRPHAATLSAREQMVLTLVLRGHTTTQIAEELSLSVHTVATHRRNINGKMNNRDLSYLLLHLDS